LNWSAGILGTVQRGYRHWLSPEVFNYLGNPACAQLPDGEFNSIPSAAQYFPEGMYVRNPDTGNISIIAGGQRHWLSPEVYAYLGSPAATNIPAGQFNAIPSGAQYFPEGMYVRNPVTGNISVIAGGQREWISPQANQILGQDPHYQPVHIPADQFNAIPVGHRGSYLLSGDSLYWHKQSGDLQPLIVGGVKSFLVTPDGTPYILRNWDLTGFDLQAQKLLAPYGAEAGSYAIWTYDTAGNLKMVAKNIKYWSMDGTGKIIALQAYQSPASLDFGEIGRVGTQAWGLVLRVDKNGTTELARKVMMLATDPRGNVLIYTSDYVLKRIDANGVTHILGDHVRWTVDHNGSVVELDGSGHLVRIGLDGSRQQLGDDVMAFSFDSSGGLVVYHDHHDFFHQYVVPVLGVVIQLAATYAGAALGGVGGAAIGAAVGSLAGQAFVSAVDHESFQPDWFSVVSSALTAAVPWGSDLPGQASRWVFGNLIQTMDYRSTMSWQGLAMSAATALVGSYAQGLLASSGGTPSGLLASNDGVVLPSSESALHAVSIFLISAALADLADWGISRSSQSSLQWEDEAAIVGLVAGLTGLAASSTDGGIPLVPPQPGMPGTAPGLVA
jgi:hypothetical protein